MYKQVLTNEIVDTINKYTIIKMKEKIWIIWELYMDTLRCGTMFA